MSGYYQLLARGLGDQVNEGFTAWVEPYSFATGGVMGTTVGAPVYDRSVSPPHFIGVAADGHDARVPRATVGRWIREGVGVARRTLARAMPDARPLDVRPAGAASVNRRRRVGVPCKRGRRLHDGGWRRQHDQWHL